MTRDEIVTALREHAERAVGNEWGSSIIGLYDNLSAAADSLKDAISRRDKQIDGMNQGMAQLAKAVAVKEEME